MQYSLIQFPSFLILSKTLLLVASKGHRHDVQLSILSLLPVRVHPITQDNVFLLVGHETAIRTNVDATQLKQTHFGQAVQ